MRIGAVRVVLDFYNNTDLARKRRELVALCEELRKTYRVSAAEIDCFDDLERGVIGFALVFPDTQEPSRCLAQLDAIARYIDSNSPARVISEESELMEHSGSYDPEQIV